MDLASKKAKPDEHVDFLTFFNFEKNLNKTYLYISVDSEYALYLNGKLVVFGQYPDYPHYKVYDKIDITEYLINGKNTLAIEAWYLGENCSTYAKGDAGLWFLIKSGDKEICLSNESVLSRLSKTYINYRKKYITGQLGFGYAYDANGEDNWKTGEIIDFLNSVTFDRDPPKIKRPIKKLINEALIEGKLISSVPGKLVFDFEREYTGFFNLSFENTKAQNIDIRWGEHLVDGCIRCTPSRDFTISYRSKPDKNEYFGYLRRLGMRYIEIYYDGEMPKNLKFTIIQRSYPLKKLDFVCESSELQKIYDICVYTLKLCMHDHYEDCPWREQAMYALDTRNQMLCGYYAFKEFDFARACLKLMSEDSRGDGLHSICYPSSIDLTIPSFGLHYLTALREYADHSGDWSLIKEVMPKVEKLLATYKKHLGNNELLTTFPGENYWNFYEWNNGLNGYYEDRNALKVDLVFNCLYSIALQQMGYMCNRLNIKNDYTEQTEKINIAIQKTFYNQDIGAYSMYAGDNNFSELGNSLAIIAGVTNEEIAKNICKNLTSDNKWSKITLSMKCFKYDALLKTSKNEYRDYIIEDIKRVYNKMLDMGATTVWETEVGESDFGGAGSLCHGWSALPVYYLHILLDKSAE